MSSLETLVLASTGISAAGAKAIAESEYLSNLKHLDLRRNSIDEESRRILLERFGEDCRVEQYYW